METFRRKDPHKPWFDFDTFTVFIERKIMNKLYGKAVFDFNAIGGLMELKETVARLGADHPHTVLMPVLEGGVDPDDVFSKVPYEKGFAFLVYLEHMTRGDVGAAAPARDSDAKSALSGMRDVDVAGGAARASRVRAFHPPLTLKIANCSECS